MATDLPRVNVYLQPHLHDALKDLSQQYDRSVSYLINRAVEKFIAEYADQPEEVAK